ncbi:MAG: ADP-ribosylglycohydrolase family protein [Myxococcota bacterium]
MPVGRRPSFDRVLGALWGVAVGDAAGLPYEGLSAARVARSFRGLDRYWLFGRRGVVSDDTEQTALVAQALLRGSSDGECVALLRRSLAGWFARLPFGVGGATARACVRMLWGAKETGIDSAGNGAAMRAGVLGIFVSNDESRRRTLGRSMARLTHRDVRAVEASLFVAELSALAVHASPAEARGALVERAASVLTHPELRSAIENALALGRKGAELSTAAQKLGTTGFCVHSMGLATYCFVRFGDAPADGIEAAIRAGGDTDTHAAIVGGWLGALHGASRLPTSLTTLLPRGPFGRAHLEDLAAALVRGGQAPRWSWPIAFARNVLLFPIILAHGLARLV